VRGLFAEKDDPELAQRLTSQRVTRALVLIPAGGLLSTAARAQRLGANAVVGELPVVGDLWEILKKAASGPHSPSTVRLEFWKHRQRGGMSLKAPPLVISEKPFFSRMTLACPLRFPDRAIHDDGALAIAEVG